jgi:hypothetical protein
MKMTVYTSDELKRHVGHKIVVVLYNDKYVDEEVTVECETCYEILYSQFKYCPNCHRKMDKYGQCPDKCDER